MVFTKKHVLRTFFFIEILVFVAMYLFSSQGLRVLRSMKKENKKVADAVGVLRSEIKELEGKVAEWENNSYYKEKIAREELQMARDNDEVYFIKE